MGAVTDFISNTVKSVFGGGSDSGGSTTVQASGAAAAPEASSADKESNPNDAIKKRKRGKSSLMVTPADTSGNSTGLNV